MLYSALLRGALVGIVEKQNKLFMMFKNGVRSLSEGFALSTLLLMAINRMPFFGKTTSLL